MIKAFQSAAHVAVVSLLLASAATAQPAKPNYKDYATVERWMADNKIDQGGATRQDKDWLVIGVAPEGVYLSRRALEETRSIRGPKFAIAVNRLELFEPIVDGARTINSISFDYEVDCLHKTMRRILLTSYAKHNLVNKPVTEKINDPSTAISADPMMKPVIDDICRAIE